MERYIVVENGRIILKHSDKNYVESMVKTWTKNAEHSYAIYELSATSRVEKTVHIEGVV